MTGYTAINTSQPARGNPASPTGPAQPANGQRPAGGPASPGPASRLLDPAAGPVAAQRVLRDQQRARHAYQVVGAVPPPDRDGYAIAVNDLGANILRNGLSAALAALERQKDGRGKLLLDHLAGADVSGLGGTTWHELPARAWTRCQRVHDRDARDPPRDRVAQARHTGHVRRWLIMRAALPRQSPDHIGLAYSTWAPVGADGKLPKDSRATWLSRLAQRPIARDYEHAFMRWESSFDRPGDRVIKLELASRLLVGHGNPSATDVGLTVHHTWGVPVIPGSALKGLLAHYVDVVYGPDEHSSGERAAYGGVTWTDRRIQRGPGDIYRALFGAPDAEEDRELRERNLAAGASRGLVSFHDALYVPRCVDGDTPFATDVLTVHQKAYYDSTGETLPNDYDDPNPVAFLTVRPGVRMLFALSGPEDWTTLAARLLIDALDEWGVGGKTSSGYGRVVRPGAPDAAARLRAAGAAGGRRVVTGGATRSAGPRYKRGDRITVTRDAGPSKTVKFRTDDGVLGHFLEQAPSVAVGETVEVWVANVGAGTYTLTLQPPKDKKLKAAKR